MTTEKVPDAEVPGLLRDSGLLFQINRTLLHPFGLALAVEVSDEPGGPDGKTYLIRTTDPTGMDYSPESLEQGEKKFVEFLASKTDQIRRRESLGYPHGVQATPNELKPVEKPNGPKDLLRRGTDALIGSTLGSGLCAAAFGPVGGAIGAIIGLVAGSVLSSPDELE